MDPKKLLTLTFAKNVGTPDRVFRLVSGIAAVAAGALLPVPGWAAPSCSWCSAQCGR